jgi:hypothetical protein
MSMVLDQDKTGQSVDPTLVNIQSAEHLELFSPGNNLPYIDAIHYYALTETESI